MSHILKFVPDFGGTDEGCWPSLTFKERMIGFVVCFALSVLVYILAWYRMMGLLIGSTAKFALTYTLGNFLSILATGFLIGFSRQFSSLFDEKRKIASLVYLGSMAMTLICAIVLKQGVLTLTFIIIQLCAFVWYAASYIPWGRECIASCCKKSFTPGV